MKPGDGLGGFQIGQRPGDAQDPVIFSRISPSASALTRIGRSPCTVNSA